MASGKLYIMFRVRQSFLIHQASLLSQFTVFSDPRDSNLLHEMTARQTVVVPLYSQSITIMCNHEIPEVSVESRISKCSESDRQSSYGKKCRERDIRFISHFFLSIEFVPNSDGSSP